MSERVRFVCLRSDVSRIAFRFELVSDLEDDPDVIEAVVAEMDEELLGYLYSTNTIGIQTELAPQAIADGGVHEERLNRLGGLSRIDDECVDTGDRPTQEHSGPQRVGTTLRQALTGLQIGLANLQAHCTSCGQTCHEGQQVWVYAYRTADDPEWLLSRCYCSECAPDCIETPTLGTSEALIEARLDVVSLSSQQRHNLCLSEIEILTFSPLTEGTSP